MKPLAIHIHVIYYSRVLEISSNVYSINSTEYFVNVISKHYHVLALCYNYFIGRGNNIYFNRSLNTLILTFFAI